MDASIFRHILTSMVALFHQSKSYYIAGLYLLNQKSWSSIRCPNIALLCHDTCIWYSENDCHIVVAIKSSKSVTA